MKKVSTQTTSSLSAIMIAFIGLFAIGQLVLCLISPNTVLGWLKAAHIAFYSTSTAVTPKMTSYIINQSFENMFSVSYIRIMSMYVFVLCIPFLYALVHVFFISQNGSSNKPFRSSTNACLRTVTVAMIAEVFLATVLYMVLKFTMRSLPFYFMYTMVAVALYSLFIIVFALTISGLINRMGDLRNEHAKKLRKQQYEAAPEAAHKSIALEEPAAPQAKKPAKTDSFDDVLKSIEE